MKIVRKPVTRIITFALIMFSQTSVAISDDTTSAIGNDEGLEQLSSATVQSLLLQMHELQQLGRHRQAIANLLQASQLTKSAKDDAMQAEIFAALGLSYAQLGETDNAKLWLQKAIDISSGQQLEIRASTLNNLGNLLMQESKYKKALDKYYRSVEISSKHEFTALKAQASVNAARAALSTENNTLTRQLIDQSKTFSAELADSIQKAQLLINIATVVVELHNTSTNGDHDWLIEPYTLLQSARNYSTRFNDNRTLSWSLGYLAQLYLLEQRYEDALRLTREAEFIAQTNNYPDVMFRWQWQAGKILKQLGEHNQAIAAYDMAIQTVQPIRHDISGSFGDRHSSFRNIIGPLYFEYADLLLKDTGNKNGDTQQRLTQERLTKARDIIEQFKSAELEDFFQDDCVAELKARTTGLDKLEKRTAVIYPILLAERTELLVSMPDGLHQFTVNVDKKTIQEEVRIFRQYLEKRTTHQYMPHAKQLYTWLISPVIDALASADIDTLIIVPDGVLRNIPWGALHNGEDFLIQQFALAYTPGLKVTDPSPIDRTQLNILLTGLSSAVQDFPALPFVEAELNLIHKNYGGKILLNEAFSTQLLNEELHATQYNIVHIASHANFGSNPHQTFLLTYDEKFNMDQLEQFVGIGKYRKKPIELLTLSACQTAAGDDRAALGLAGVAVKSGARSVLATLWFVNDETTSLLISDFYHYLKDPSTSKASALRKAQLEIIKDRRYRHPGYWAPYLMIGNWL